MKRPVREINFWTAACDRCDTLTQLLQQGNKVSTDMHGPQNRLK
jgi:hypothetical protein